MIRQFLKWFLSDTDEVKERHKIYCYDSKDNQYSLIDLIVSLTKHVQQLEDRIKVLEEENIETTNELYRLENSLDARIDILVEHCRTAKNV